MKLITAAALVLLSDAALDGALDRLHANRVGEPDAYGRESLAPIAYVAGAYYAEAQARRTAGNPYWASHPYTKDAPAYAPLPEDADLPW